MSNKSVLIIDDDSRNTFALKAVLKSKGFNCITAAGATEGISQITPENNVGIILLDMMMPEMDGYEALSIIRLGPDKNLPVIAVTAQAMVGDKDKCLDAGATDYISKPVDIDALLPLLKMYLR